MQLSSSLGKPRRDARGGWVVVATVLTANDEVEFATAWVVELRFCWSMM